MGLRYPKERVADLLKGVLGMKESVTYQAIVEEGRAEGLAEGRKEGRAEGREEGREEALQATLLKMGSRLFGAPHREVESEVQRIMDADRLTRMIDRLLDVASWSALLATP
jgi:predicted transposase YdaD